MTVIVLKKIKAFTEVVKVLLLCHVHKKPGGIHPARSEDKSDMNKITWIN